MRMSGRGKSVIGAKPGSSQGPTAALPKPMPKPKPAGASGPGRRPASVRAGRPPTPAIEVESSSRSPEPTRARREENRAVQNGIEDARQLRSWLYELLPCLICCRHWAEELARIDGWEDLEGTIAAFIEARERQKAAFDRMVQEDSGFPDFKNEDHRGAVRRMRRDAQSMLAQFHTIGLRFHMIGCDDDGDSEGLSAKRRRKSGRSKP